jgi:hypothetical protein
MREIKMNPLALTDKELVTFSERLAQEQKLPQAYQLELIKRLARKL